MWYSGYRSQKLELPIWNQASTVGAIGGKTRKLVYRPGLVGPLTERKGEMYKRDPQMERGMWVVVAKLISKVNELQLGQGVDLQWGSTTLLVREGLSDRWLQELKSQA